MGDVDAGALLTMLAIDHEVSPATHPQALTALLLLYREVLGLDLP